MLSAILIVVSLNLCILVMLIALLQSTRRGNQEERQNQKDETAEYMEELRTLIKAARVAAESARANKTDAVRAAGEIKDIAVESTKELKEEIGRVPERTADLIEKKEHP